MHADRREHVAVRVEDRHGNADDAVDALLVVQGVARGTDAREFGLQVGEARQGARCGGLQLAGLDEVAAQAR